MMMKNYDESVEINVNHNNPYFPDHYYRILIIGGPESGESNELLNLINHEGPDAGKIYLYLRIPFKSKYQLLIKGREYKEIKQTKMHPLIIYN